MAGPGFEFEVRGDASCRQGAKPLKEAQGKASGISWFREVFLVKTEVFKTRML